MPKRVDLCQNTGDFEHTKREQCVKPYFMKGTNSGLHDLCIVGGEVNKLANHKVLRVSFIASIPGTSKLHGCGTLFITLSMPI